MTKVLSQTGLTELIQLSKNEFLPKSGAVEATTVTLATVATTGSYNDLSNKPTIPTVNNATLTIQKNGSNVATFTANASNNVTANISVPNVTSTYIATGTDAVNGVAVSNAIATKQDNLVSGTNIKTINGTSLLGSGNIVIESSSTPDVDNSTISYNSSNELQTIAVKNKRDNSTLPIWQGTESQWNQGEATPWYYWQTSVTVGWTNGGSLPSSENWFVSFGNNRFVAVGASTGNTAYSTDNGETWAQGGNLPSSSLVTAISFGNNRFVVTYDGGYSAYSTDGGETWTQGGNLSSNNYFALAFGNDRFVAINDSGYSYYSINGGETWAQGGRAFPFQGSVYGLGYGNGRFVAVYCGTRGSQASAYSTDGGETWIYTDNLPSSSTWMSVIYFNNKFITISGKALSAFSTDGGETWTQGGNLPAKGVLVDMINGNNTLVVIASGNNYTQAYSTDDGMTWTGSLSDVKLQSVAFGNNVFVAVPSSGSTSAIFSSNYKYCYTDTANPTTSSTVYSAPAVTSSYTISSVTSGAITLSDNNTYYYNQSGNQYTYQSVGTAHPDWLCFINGVGVKIGNTTIATA